MDNARVSPDPAESAAFRLVAMYTAAEVEPYDHSGRQGVVDALLHFPEGRTAALEITSVAAPGQRQLNSVRRRRDLLPRNPGRWTWLATARTPRDFAELKDRSGRIILRCEELGITSAESAITLTADPDFAWLVKSSATLRGFPSVPNARGDDAPLPVLEGMEGGGRSEGPRDFEDAIDKLLREDHVLKRAEKLRRSGYSEQHLFLTIDETALPESAHYALRNHRAAPAGILQLPLEVTHLWLLVAFSHRLFLATAEGWDSFDMNPPAIGKR